MKAWLERVHPKGDPIDLPDGPATLVFGKSPKATIVFDDPLVSGRHCELAFAGDFWRLRDLGTEAGTSVNGAAVRWPRALFRGDVVQLGTTRLRFCSDLPVEEPGLVEAISRDPDAEAPYLVYADWLLERGAPLGERIATSRAGGRVDHLGWLGPLGDAYLSGALEVDWRLGFMRRAVLRRVPAPVELDWRAAVSTLFQLPVARFLQELTLDLPRLERTPRMRAVQDVAQAQLYLAGLPSLPVTLKRLSLGYLLGEAPAPVPAAEALALRVPALRGTDVFLFGRALKLRLASVETGTQVDGLRDGVRALTDVTRLRRGNKGQVHLETPPGLRFVSDGNPCFFQAHEGGWRLLAGRLRGEVRVNGRVDAVYDLLPGDLVDLHGACRFKVEVTV